MLGSIHILDEKMQPCPVSECSVVTGKKTALQALSKNEYIDQNVIILYTQYLNLYIGGPISTNVYRKFWIADLTLSTIVCRAEVPDVMSRSYRHIWDADTDDIRLH